MQLKSKNEETKPRLIPNDCTDVIKFAETKNVRLVVLLSSEKYDRYAFEMQGLLPLAYAGLQEKEKVKEEQGVREEEEEEELTLFESTASSTRAREEKSSFDSEDFDDMFNQPRSSSRSSSERT